jgi:hypothetical protein
MHASSFGVPIQTSNKYTPIQDLYLFLAKTKDVQVP